ncbi:hypothetical protein BH18THE1_BH18THE1_10200 [soil metagenome]
MEDLIGTFAQKTGIPPQVASMGMALVSKYLLQKASPDKASGLMSMLPSGLTNMFSDEDKTQFTTTQQNVPREQVIDKLSNECCNGNKQQAQKVYEEAVNTLKEKTGQQGQGLLQNILGEGQV